MVLAIGPAVRADYSTEITGTKDGELADSRDKIAELKQYAEKGPAFEEVRRRRADRNLQRLADAAHDLGQWGAGPRPPPGLSS
jgi:hypothetical protein